MRIADSSQPRRCRRSPGPRLGGGVVTLCTLLACAAVVHAGDEPVLRWRHEFGSVGGVDRGPTVDVYRDGTVRVLYPPYMKRSGTYEMRLRSEELDKLVDSIRNTTVADFQPDGVLARCRRAEARRPTRAAGDAPDVVGVFDAATTRLEYRAAARQVGIRRTVPPTVARSVSWYALASSAKQFPTIRELQDLAAVERQMKALSDHPTLVRVPGVR